MGLFSFRFPGRLAKDIDQVSQEVAKKCHAALDSQLSGLTQAMGLSEMRGYVRAKAGLQVRRAAKLAAYDRSRFPETAVERITRIATERVVHLVVRDVIAARTAPAMVKKSVRVPVPLRKAA